MTATATERKPRVVITGKQRFLLTSLVLDKQHYLASGELSIDDFIEALPESLQGVNANHVKGVCKEHGITLLKVDRSIQSIENAMANVVRRCKALNLDPGAVLADAIAVVEDYENE